MSFFAQLRQLEDQGIDLVEILGQDRHLDSPGQLQEILALLSRNAESLYAELLYYLTYRRFAAEEAEQIWNSVMERKREMEAGLGRPVSFRVAAVDCLSEQLETFRGIHILGRPEFEAILSYVNVDEVSGVYSRRYFNAELVRELTRARRYASAMSLLLIDLDSFKSINDSLGHVEGDVLLRQVGRMLQDTTREADSVCRFGGDEFAVILPETSTEEAFATAERIRAATRKLRVSDGNGAQRELTMSIGGATFPGDGKDVGELVASADQMCLEAKRAGKDTTRIRGRRSRDLDDLDLDLDLKL